MSNRPRASLIRRAWPAVAIAGASAALISVLDNPAQLTAGTPVARSPIADPSASKGPTAVTAPPPAITQPVPGSPATSVPGAAVPEATTPVPAQGQPATTAAATPSAGACAAAPIDGPVEDTRWGPVQVEVVLRADGSVCKADAIQTPNDRDKSVRINQAAVPILNRRSVAAGNANFHAVSGATVTSNGYIQSLQAILDGK